MKPWKIKCYGCNKMYNSENPPKERPSDNICTDCCVWLAETIANNEMAEQAARDNTIKPVKTTLF